MKLRFLLGGLWLLSILPAAAQSTYVPVQNQDYYRLIDRYEIKAGGFAPDMPASVRPVQRKAVAQLAERLWAQDPQGAADRYNLQYLMADNWEWLSDSTQALAESRKPFLKALYQRKAAFYSAKVPDFNLSVNPVMDLYYGKDTEALGGAPFGNTRGVEVRGTVDDRVGFYLYAVDNQIRFPRYVQRYAGAQASIPGEGNWKDNGSQETDFFSARGYVTFRATKHIHLQAGYDRHQLGNGLRSVVLSPFATDYLFLKINTQVWRFTYTNLFAQMMADNQKVAGKNYFPKKFMSFHRLGFNVTSNFNVGVFENIVFSRQDYTAGNVGYELAYLNPIIFFRSLEYGLGDADNSMLGLDFKWNFAKRFQLYGQFVLDDFNVAATTQASGWFANKMAFQFGGKYIDVAGIQNLDLQLEANVVTPYTYAHKDGQAADGTRMFTNFQHYNQALAHPLGANFYELLGVVRYQPSFLPSLTLLAKGFYWKQGMDASKNENMGSDIFQDYNVNTQEFDNKLLQGTVVSSLAAHLEASYQVRHNLFIDARALLRKSSSAEERFNQKDTFFSLGLRLNAAMRNQEF